MAKLKSRMLTDDERKFVLSLTADKINKSIILKMFADTYNRKKMFEAYDTFYLKKGEFYNSEEILTTPGKYIFNILCLPKKYLVRYRYCNEALDKKYLSDIIEGRLGSMIIENSLSVKEYGEYLDNAQWYGFSCAYFINSAININTLKPTVNAQKKKKELFEKYREELDNNNLEASSVVENQIYEASVKDLKDMGEEFWDYFEKIEGKGKSSYNKVTVMGGGILNPATGKFKVTRSNYFDGMSKEELPVFNNVAIQGGYGRAVETAKGGYESKKLTNAMQSVVLDEPDTDCGTTTYQEIEVTNFIKDLITNRYILERGELVLLTSENISKYIGKTVKMRTPEFCKSDKICNKCAGELYYSLGTKTLGMIASDLGGVLVNLPMKKFHDLTIKLKDIDLDKYIKAR